MAIKHWVGRGVAVAQVSTVQITGFDASTTYKLTVGGQVVSAVGNTDVNTTASDLADAWNNSTHAYFTGVTASSATDTVTLTADTAGVPFVATSSVTGGTGTIGSVTESTANAGPNDWNTVENWLDGSVPSAGDTLVFKDNDVNLCWNLDQGTDEYPLIVIEQTYTGKIGLRRDRFATSADGDTLVITAPEYRETYLKVECFRWEIGNFHGDGNPIGSGRIKISAKGHSGGTPEIVIYNTSNTPSETNMEAVRIETAATDFNFIIHRAPGGVGLGTDSPGDTYQFAIVRIFGDSQTRVICGLNPLSVGTWEQYAGRGLLRAPDNVTLTTIECFGGILVTEGKFLISDVYAFGGLIKPNHRNKSGSNAITRLRIDGGSVDGTESLEARTWNTLQIETIGGSVRIPSQVTMSNLIFNDAEAAYNIEITNLSLE